VDGYPPQSCGCLCTAHLHLIAAVPLQMHFLSLILCHHSYAPFCKHLFVPNFTGAKVGAVTITDSNKHLLRYPLLSLPATLEPTPRVQRLTGPLGAAPQVGLRGTASVRTARADSVVRGQGRGRTHGQVSRHHPLLVRSPPHMCLIFIFLLLLLPRRSFVSLLRASRAPQTSADRGRGRGAALRPEGDVQGLRMGHRLRKSPG
jgi:hypothetical protein